jgi:glycosyltransferase involved in cell wall biosynthesis
VERFGVSENVSLPGARRDIPDLLAACDVFVLSSIREGLPVSLLEAMASGCAIAATTVGGIPEAVRNGESALLVPPDEPRALAGAIGRLLGNRELAARFGENASRVIDERYSAAGVTKKIEEIYTRLAAAARGDNDRSA